MCCQTLNIFPPSNPAPWCLASSVCKKELNGPVLESACERAQKIRPILQKIQTYTTFYWETHIYIYLYIYIVRYWPACSSKNCKEIMFRFARMSIWQPRINTYLAIWIDIGQLNRILTRRYTHTQMWNIAHLQVIYVVKNVIVQSYTC